MKSPMEQLWLTPRGIGLGTYYKQEIYLVCSSWHPTGYNRWICAPPILGSCRHSFSMNLLNKKASDGLNWELNLLQSFLTVLKSPKIIQVPILVDLIWLRSSQSFFLFCGSWGPYTFAKTVFPWTPDHLPFVIKKCLTFITSSTWNNLEAQMLSNPPDLPVEGVATNPNSPLD